MQFSNATISCQKLPISDIAEKAWESVVAIYVYDKIGNAHCCGTGFFVAPGKILTNAHVIKGAYSAEVIPDFDSISYSKVKILKFDNEEDLALLEVEDKERPFLPLEENQENHLGQPAIAIGFPLGEVKAVSEGIISTKRVNYSLFITSAPLAPGSSGSPILNQKGNVIGVFFSTREDAQNFNYVIDIETIKRFLIKLDNPRELKTARSFVAWRVTIKKISNKGMNIVNFIFDAGKWIFFTLLKIASVLIFICLVLLVVMSIFRMIKKGIFKIIKIPTFRNKIILATIILGIFLIWIRLGVSLYSLLISCFDEGSLIIPITVIGTSVVIGTIFYFLIKRAWNKLILKDKVVIENSKLSQA